MSSSKEIHTLKPKLWIVTELFYPDQTSTSFIVSKIADKMMEKYDVNVITDSSLYQENNFSEESSFTIDEGIKVIRVKSKKRDKNNLIQRAMKVVSLSVKLAKVLFRNVRKGEKVFIVTNPALLLVFLSWIRNMKKLQLYILVHDVFPENTLPPGIIKSESSLLYKFISSIFNRAYSNADNLIVLGRDMKEVVENKIRKSKNKPSVHIIENWGDIDKIKPSSTLPDILKERHKNNYITIQYAGNIGRLQGLENFLQLFSSSNNKRLYFDLWGGGALTDNLKKWVVEHELEKRVEFHGIYSREDQNIILNSTDIAIVTLSKGMYGLGVPSKTYNILAAGKPILFIGDLNSENALLIKESDIGFCFSPDDEKGITEFLNNLSIESLCELKEKGRNARVLAEEQYSEHKILARFIELV